MSVLTRIVVFLNAIANTLGEIFTPIGYLPGWLSATLVGLGTGAGMVVVFKYTSNQHAIKKARQTIRANLLAIKLFKESVRVGIQAQFGVLRGAIKLLLLALVPMAVMMVPMTLLLGQLGLWYQRRPLNVDEETVVTLTLRADAEAPLPTVQLQPTEAAELVVGPIRVLSQRKMDWALRALRPGVHILQFAIDGQIVEKEFAVGPGYVRVSPKRPGWVWSDILLHPREAPFPEDAPVQMIDIDYPERSSWTSGTDTWVIYWFVVSLVAGFCLKGTFKVNL